MESGGFNLLPGDTCWLRRNVPPAIGDTGAYSGTLGMFDVMIAVILAHYADGKLDGLVSVSLGVGGRAGGRDERGVRVQEVKFQSGSDSCSLVMHSQINM